MWYSICQNLLSVMVLYCVLHFIPSKVYYQCMFFIKKDDMEMEVQWWHLYCKKLELEKLKLETKIEYFYLQDSEYINEEFFIKISVDLVTMAKSLLIFNRQQKQRRNWSWMMMKDKVKIEGKNNKRKNPASICSQDKIVIVV